jgi:Sigma-70, region 4
VRRKKSSTRGVTRDPSEMHTVVEACKAAIAKERGGRQLEPAETRAALAICLRDRYECTLEQIGEVLDLSAERVRQVYQSAKRARERSAREARAPVEELSTPACQALSDVGLASDGSMREVTELLPILRLASQPPHEHGSNATFHAHLIDPATVREIEEWLRRHGVVFR